MSTIYTYLVQYTETGKKEVFRTVKEGYTPPGAVILRKLDQIEFPPKWPEESPKTERKSFWKRLFGG